jgi:NADH:ubiquinone oxidoreductase subunit C
MQPAEIFFRLEKQFSGKVSGFKADVPEPYLFVGAEAFVEVCRFLSDYAELNFEVLSDKTAVYWTKEEKIQLVYHLYS